MFKSIPRDENFVADPHAALVSPHRSTMSSRSPTIEPEKPNAPPVKAPFPEPSSGGRAAEEHIIPHNNLPLVFLGLMMTMFLVST
jgi:hypothetical protein